MSVVERRHRNRGLLLVVVLAVVNAYVFLWRDQGVLDGLGGLPSAVVHDGGALPPFADPPQGGCGGDPVRIFDGLEHLVALHTDLSHGRTPRLALLEMGIESTEIDAVESAIRTNVDLSLLAGSGAPLRVALDRHGRIHAVELELAEGHLLQACRDGQEMRVRNIQHPLRTDVVVIGIELDRNADVEAAIAAAGEKPELANLIADALGFDIDLRTEARPGDRLQVMVEKRWLGRSFHRYREVLAIRYLGANGRVAYYRYQPEGGKAALFDGKGEPRARALLRSPVAYHPVHPDARALLEPKIEVVAGRHGAVYRLPEGAPLVSLADGVVRWLGDAGELGSAIEIGFSDGTVARYGHLMRTVGDLELGARVHQGQLIGLAGHSGRTPHDRLRLELWREDRGERVMVDPALLTAKGDKRPSRTGEPIAASQMERYREDVAPWSRALRQAAALP